MADDKKGAKTPAKQPKKAPVYDKSQILAVSDFARDIDLLNVLLDDGKQYTMDDARKLVETYKKKGVK